MPDISFSIDFGKLPVVVQRGTHFNDALRAGLSAGGTYLKGKWAIYPPVRRKKVAQSWGDKQRRGFFAKLNAGQIDVPYRRGSSPGSERLAQRFAVSVAPDGRSVTVGNNASYAPLVVGLKKQQSAYHRNNWRSIEDVVKAHGAETVRIIKVTSLGYLGR